MKKVIENPAFIQKIINLSKGRTIRCYDGTIVKLPEFPESISKIEVDYVFNVKLKKYTIYGICLRKVVKPDYYYNQKPDLEAFVDYIESLNLPPQFSLEEIIARYLAKLHSLPTPEGLILTRISHDKYKCKYIDPGVEVVGDVRDLAPIYEMIHKLGFDSFSKEKQCYKNIVLV